MRVLNRTAGYLSRRRRGPVTGVVLMLLGLVLTGTLYAAFSPASAQNTQSDAELAAKGRNLFLVGCSSCHGQNGQGQLDTRGNQFGPSLVGVGAASVDFQVGTGRMPLAAPVQQALRGPVSYSDQEIAQLAAYVASLGPGPEVPTSGDYSLDGLSDLERQDAITRGGNLFLTNCTACHNFDGQGGALPRGVAAPSILNVMPRYIYEALLTGPQQMPSFSNGNLTPQEKRDIIAYIGSLQAQPSYGGFGLGNIGPVSEGLAAWLVGIGGLVGFAVWIAAHTTRSSKKKGSPA